jgi:hypothetical protein
MLKNFNPEPVAKTFRPILSGPAKRFNEPDPVVYVEFINIHAVWQQY